MKNKLFLTPIITLFVALFITAWGTSTPVKTDEKQYKIGKETL